MEDSKEGGSDDGFSDLDICQDGIADALRFDDSSDSFGALEGLLDVYSDSTMALIIIS